LVAICGIIFIALGLLFLHFQRKIKPLISLLGDELILHSGKEKRILLREIASVKRLETPKKLVSIGTVVIETFDGTIYKAKYCCEVDHVVKILNEYIKSEEKINPKEFFNQEPHLEAQITQDEVFKKLNEPTPLVQECMDKET
jgi:hypothetical protein